MGAKLLGSAIPLLAFTSAACGSSSGTPSAADRGQVPETKLMPLAEGAYHAAPPVAGPSVVIFLHGMYGPEGEAEEREQQRMVAYAAAKHGLAVLFPRGRQGLCNWSAELADRYCWPSNVSHVDRAREVVDDLKRQLVSLRVNVPTATEPPFVMGFSNGGFFAAMIAAHHLLEARAFAVLHGGPGDDAAAFDPRKPKPCLLIAADDDVWQRPKMGALHEMLGKAGWKAELRTRPGPHRLAAEDVAAAMQFFATLGS